MATVTSNTVRYRIDSTGEVSLAGNAWVDSAYEEKFFRLPVTARPGSTLAFRVTCETEGYSEMTVLIYADGGISKGYSGNYRVFFDGVSFLVGQ